MSPDFTIVSLAAMTPRETANIVAALRLWQIKITKKLNFVEVVKVLDGTKNFEHDAPMTTEEIDLLIHDLQNQVIKEKPDAIPGKLLMISVLKHDGKYYAFESPSDAFDLEMKLQEAGHEAESDALPITPHDKVMELFASLVITG